MPIKVACLAALLVMPVDAGLNARLLSAVMLHDAAAVQVLLEQGASPEAKNDENDRTALFFAAELGDAPIVRLLLQAGADVTARDKPHREPPVGAAARRRHAEVVRLLLARDGQFADRVASDAVYQDDVAVLDAALETGRLTAEGLSFLLDDAERNGSSAVVARLRKVGVVLPKPGVAVPESVLATYIGSYSGEDGAKPLLVTLKRGALYVTRGSQTFELSAFTPTYFVEKGKRLPTLTFARQGDRVVGAELQDADGWARYSKVAAKR